MDQQDNFFRKTLSSHRNNPRLNQGLGNVHDAQKYHYGGENFYQREKR